jgi:predicted kinase
VHYYRVAGLTVASEFALPGLIAAPAADASQVTIRRGEAPKALPHPQATGPIWQIAGRQFLLRIPGIARFLIEPPGEILVSPESERNTADIPIFLVGTVFGILLHLRDQVVLHASAVRVGDRAVLFCGAAGAGKSTLAAALGQRGHLLVTDDFCAIATNGSGAPTIYPDGRQLKLWAQAIDHLGIDTLRGQRVRESLEKFYVEPAQAFSEPLVVGAVYALLEARAPRPPNIDKANVVDATLLLRRHAYRPLLVSTLGQQDSYFRAASMIAANAGVFYLARPLDFGAMTDVVTRLEGHWRDLGLMAA